MPIEFALVSRKRNRALAAVIDHGFGEHCAASVIVSRKDNLPEAVADLARRERCDEQHIGALHRGNGFSRAKRSHTTALIAARLMLQLVLDFAVAEPLGGYVPEQR